MSTYLITGSLGFIGYSLSKHLLEKGANIIGIDNYDPYYDLRLKDMRLENLKEHKNFTFIKASILDKKILEEIVSNHDIKGIYNLAAKAGVRTSIEHPLSYYETNVLGFINILEIAKNYKLDVVHASSSSVYGLNPSPFKESLPTDKPLSPYAASKKASEEIAYTYHYLYGINISILRYFTVYGPFGRPDMSMYRFIKSILTEQPLIIYGDGEQKRSYTYIDDVVEATEKAMHLKGYEILNIGNDQTISINKIIKLIEKHTSKKAHIKYENAYKADMPITYADITKAKSILGWEPKTQIEEGIKKTIEWFKSHPSALEIKTY